MHGAKTRPSRTFSPSVSNNINMRGVKMNATDSLSLLSLPPGCVLEVLRHLDARSLVMLELTGSRYFSAREQGRRMSLVEDVAKDAVLQRLCGSMEAAERFRWDGKEMGENGRPGRRDCRLGGLGTAEGESPRSWAARQAGPRSL